ncbi:hypothetical protein BT63DRAFT_439460 [Microthyrium microscopicum]|uniref:NAD(P)-binding domain-containing protein n=1 Tax=Microthyrium microscopicum TaxID=703497 RepID=A0A6A6UG37_9PEZI|nr:hypothetical protein BT63DRAFT_439460 [Microthyrium microscopicum]
MKVLITGATGLIGGGALNQALLRPEINSIIALSRKDLPANISSHHKVKTFIIKDFSKWESGILEEIKNADAMIWALGTSDNNQGPNLEYPVAFQDAFVQVLEPRNGKAPFRWIQLSGKFVVQDQSAPLWFLETPRKTKGRCDTRTLQRNSEHGDTWHSIVVKPGGVFPKGSVTAGLMSTILGRGWVIQDDELGAVMVDLAINGCVGDEDSVMLNQGLVQRGKELLQGA